MPDVKSGHLRIYCICGQKMKVSAKMFGLPGKCIACRQKIRIPKPTEVPEGTTEIYLKDYPELLRGPKRAAAEVEEERQAQEALDAARPREEKLDDSSTPITELDLVEGSTPQDRRSEASSLPIDPLQPLQVLCSLHYKLERQLETMEEYQHDDDALTAEVTGHLTRVRNRRAELDDYLHQLLMETAIELANTQEKIAQARLEARVGDTTFDEFQEAVHRFRTRRERLERRQQNLRGWLATTDPYVAGGFLDLSIEQIPAEGAKVTVPPEPGANSPLLTTLVAGMREALNRRGRADQKLDEAERLAEEDAGNRSLEDSRQECRRVRRMARNAVAFQLARLEQLEKDYKSDLETIRAQEDAARDRLKLGEIERGDYDASARLLLRAKKDVARAQTVVARALAANTPNDVPRPQGTFVERLGLKEKIGPAPDALVAWVSALALAVGVVLPVVGNLSLIAAFRDFQGLSGAAWSFLAPLTVALAVAAATVLSKPLTRGGVLLGVWCVGMTLGTYGLVAGFNSLDPVAAQFRSGGTWYLRPGVWLLDLGLWGTACAALIALWSSQSLRLLGLLIVGVGLAGGMLIPSDFGGTLAPRPTVDIALEEQQEDGSQAGVLRIANQGGRALNLVARPESGRSSYLVVMERRIGGNSWSDVGLDVEAIDSSPLIYELGANETYEIPFAVGPGEYQALLISDARETELRQQFSIASLPEPEPEPEPIVVAPVEPPAAPEEEFIPIAPAVAGSEVELQGILTAPDGETRFSFILHLPDETSQRVTLSLGQMLWNDWEVSEHNRNFNTVMLERDGELLILRRGERNPLAE